MASDPRQLPRGYTKSELSSSNLILRCSKCANFALEPESLCRASLSYVADGKHTYPTEKFCYLDITYNLRWLKSFFCLLQEEKANVICYPTISELLSSCCDIKPGQISYPELTLTVMALQQTSSSLWKPAQMPECLALWHTWPSVPGGLRCLPVMPLFWFCYLHV